MSALIAWLGAHASIIFSGLFFVSEGLALIPAVKANGIFQGIFKFLADKSGHSDELK